MTRLEDILNRDELDSFIAEGYISAREHGEYPYTILNYTPKTQYEKNWSHCTRTCRGLIYNHEDGLVVARSFEKFHNYGEVKPPNFTIDNAPSAISTKEDGSLGIIYPTPDGWNIATRGSFHSDQAEWATKWLHEEMPDFRQPLGYTTLCEIVYPENRIVVNYEGLEGLILLGGIDNPTGADVVPVWWDGYQADEHRNLTLEEAQMLATSHDFDAKEGLVVTWHRHEAPSFRFKIKHPEYVRLHRIITNMSSKIIWENLKEERPMDDFLQDVPDEFFDWVKEKIAEIESAYSDIAVKVASDFGKIIREKGTNVSRKQFALSATKCEYPGLLFAMKDENTEKLRSQIWKLVEPDYEIPFSRGA